MFELICLGFLLMFVHYFTCPFQPVFFIPINLIRPHISLSLSPSSLDRASHSSHLQTDDYLLDVILSALGHSRSEVRQMGATLAYNYTLANTQLVSGNEGKTGLTEAWKRDEGWVDL